MRALLLALALAASPALAQAGAPAVAHAVPFGSSDNAVELELVATDGPGAFEVSVTSAPTWLRFHAERVGASETGGVPVARLAFDVERAAPVGTPAEVAFEVLRGGTVVATHTVRLQVSAPAVLALGVPYPNPSRSGATIPFEVPEAGAVTVAVYDALGREVAVVFDGEAGPGAHAAQVPAGLPAGVYVVRLTAGASGLVRRLTMVR